MITTHAADVAGAEHWADEDMSLYRKSEVTKL